MSSCRATNAIPFDLLVAGDYEAFVSLLGAGEVRRLAPPKLSEEARAARAPRPPEELVGALQDRIHPTSGRLLAAKPIATTRRKSPEWPRDAETGELHAAHEAGRALIACELVGRGRR